MPVPRAKPFRDQKIEVLSFQLFRAVSEESFHRGVDGDYPALSINEEHGVRGRFEKPLVFYSD